MSNKKYTNSGRANFLPSPSTMGIEGLGGGSLNMKIISWGDIWKSVMMILLYIFIIKSVLACTLVKKIADKTGINSKFLLKFMLLLEITHVPLRWHAYKVKNHCVSNLISYWKSEILLLVACTVFGCICIPLP